MTILRAFSIFSIFVLLVGCSPNSGAVNVKNNQISSASIANVANIVNVKGYNKIDKSKSKWEDIQAFHEDKVVEALWGFRQSCETFLSMPTDFVHGVAGRIDLWQDPCQKVIGLHKSNMPESQKNLELKKILYNNFTPYKVKSSSSKMTGYYVPVLKGSLIKSKRYWYPIYGRPKDLDNNKKYYTRSQIDNGIIKNKADVVMWVDNPVDFFWVQIQGSGVVELDNGDVLRLKYAGNNGRSFTPITSKVQKSMPKGSSLSLKSMKEWLKSRGDKAFSYLHTNERYIFYSVEHISHGTIGKSGMKLTSRRSVAVDESYIPLGVPLWIKGKKSINDLNIDRMVIAQDIGSAIKGQKRVDFYWGVGNEAHEYASRTNIPFDMFMILPKTSF